MQKQIDRNFTIRALEVAVNTLKGLRAECESKGKQRDANDYTIEIDAMNDLHARLIKERLNEK